MRSFLVLLLSCASAPTADDTVRVVSTTKTNAQSKAVTTIDTFTRGGQTNLVRHTKTKSGTVQIRIHRFYRDGALLADFVFTRDSSGFTTEAGCPFSVSFEFDGAHHAKSALIASKDGVMVDAFTCTNGVFSPLESSRISTIDATGRAVRKEMERYTTP